MTLWMRLYCFEEEKSLTMCMGDLPWLLPAWSILSVYTYLLFEAIRAPLGS